MSSKFLQMEDCTRSDVDERVGKAVDFAYTVGPASSGFSGER